MVKYMKNLIKFHFFYLFSKQTIIFIIIALLLSSISFAGNLTSSKFLTINEEINIYFETSLAISKIILSFLIISLYTLSMMKDNDFYIYYLTQVRKRDYIISKLFLLFIISNFLFIKIFSIFLLIGFIGNSNFYFQNDFIVDFFYVLLISMINGLYGMLLMQIFQNIFVVFIPFIFVIISENLENSYILSLIIPVNYYGIGYLILMSILLQYINYKYYCFRDLNY